MNDVAKKRVNKKGWWGILLHASWPTLLAIAVTAIVFGIAQSWDGGLSAFIAGLIVWLLSAVSILLIASIWKNYRHLAIPLAMGAFVAKIVVLGVLLTVVPQPVWLHPTAAAIGALVSIVVWQAAEVLVFIRTRRLIYA